MPQRIIGKGSFALASLAASLLFAGSAQAQQAPSPTPQFDMLGFIQSATLDAGAMCPTLDPILWGGTVTLNGITMTVPCNTILQLPAGTFSWAQMFDPTVSAPVNAPSPNGLAGPSAGQSGLALADTPAPFPYPSFEIRVIGNVVRDAAGNKNYIIGLISPISQQGLNGSAGEIACIDYSTGFLYVGGTRAQPGQPCSAANGARVQLNDPIGRWGLAHSPDPRFTGDTNNSTMVTSTGYPICVPRVDPSLPGNDDPLCPKGNRPLNGDARFPKDPFIAIGSPLKTFTMLPPPGGFFSPDPSGFPDSRQQLPLMIGDWIDYAGTIAKDAAGNDYLSAHTVTANLGIFTAAGTQPAYISVESILLGTAGNAIPGVDQEATNRLFIVGFTTDPTALVDINAVDVNPCTGVETLRLLGTVDPLSEPVKGRFRLHVLGGAFMPPTREMMMVSYDQVTPPVNFDGTPGYANGLGSGSFRLPNFDFIFPEGLTFGQPIPPNNFQDLPFLAQGSGPLFGSGPIVGQLTPWPGSPVPPPVNCSAAGVAPIVNAGSDIVTGSGTATSLFATVIEDPNAFPSATFAWKQIAGPTVTLNQDTTLTPFFIAPAVAFQGALQKLTFQLTATDQFGSASSTVNVTVTGVTDLVTGTAVWRAPNLRTGANFGGGGGAVRGQKGGKLTITATSSVISSTVTMTVDGFGGMQNLGGGNYSLNALGVSFPPDQIVIHSSMGGSATVPVTFK